MNEYQNTAWLGVWEKNLNEGEISIVPTQVLCPQNGPDQGWAIYLEAATWKARLCWLSLNGDEFFIRFAGPGFPELSGCEIEQAVDNRSWRPCCYHIGAHRFWGGRLSGRAELRVKGAAMGSQTISAEIRVNTLFILIIGF